MELLVVLAITAVLAAVAYPSYAAQARKVKRIDAVMRLTRLQQMQEIWRASHGAYGSVTELGLATETPAGLYRVSIVAADAEGYSLSAEAQGAQSADSNCRFLRLSFDGAATLHLSGPDEHVSNDDASSRRCWIR